MTLSKGFKFFGKVRKFEQAHTNTNNKKGITVYFQATFKLSKIDNNLNYYDLFNKIIMFNSFY